MKAAIGAFLLGALAASSLFGGLFAASPAAAQLLTNPESDFIDTARKGAWHAVVEKTERGWLIGNPDAETRLIMFTSYACEGCYDFAFKGDPELDIALLAPGLLSLEIRPRFNHPVDLPLTLLAGCGEPEQFKVNHAILMREQKSWRTRWYSVSPFTRGQWESDTYPARTRIMTSFDFDDILADRRGYSRMDLTRCLSDRAEVSRLRANAAADNEEFGLPTDEAGHGVPHFALDGEKLEGVNDWDGLYAIFQDAFRPDPDTENP